LSGFRVIRTLTISSLFAMRKGRDPLITESSDTEAYLEVKGSGPPLAPGPGVAERKKNKRDRKEKRGKGEKRMKNRWGGKKLSIVEAL